MIIDGHCHLAGLPGTPDPAGALGRYAVRARAAGIDRTVLFPALGEADYRRENERVARVVSANPAWFVGFAFIHARRQAGSVARDVTDAVDRLRLRGLKVHRYDAPLTEEVLEAARAHGLPVIYDVMGHIREATGAALRWPDVDIIVPHLGSFADAHRPQRDLVRQLGQQEIPNLFADLSGCRRFDIVSEAARLAPHKLIFGSDGPELHPGLELAKVRALRLNPVIEAAILGGTMLRLLRRRRPSTIATTRTTAAVG